MYEPTDETSEALIDKIAVIFMHNGLKATTMDSVAAALSMSKRTLYEIFGSKNDMILALVKRWHEKQRQCVEQIFNNSSNMMEALYRVFYIHRNQMKDVNPNFYRDMDEHFKSVRVSINEQDKEWRNNMMRVIERGIEQGVFRPDEEVNYAVSLQMIRIQMESLKRMEEFFPPGFTISEAFKSISLGMLRSIATPEGMKILDNLEYNKNNI